MANQEHLEILKRGVTEWNRWRVANLTIVPDLVEANLSRAHLNYAQLQQADLTRTDFRDAHLLGTNLSSAHLNGANLLGADLTGADLAQADLTGADLTGADLTQAHLYRAHLYRAHLVRAHLVRAHLGMADLSGANLTQANLAQADLTGADLRGTHFSGADLRGAYFSGADLKGVQLGRADLRGALLQEALLQEALLQGALLQKAQLQKAQLQGANLLGADLVGANLVGADLHESILGFTIFGDMDLSAVNGLETIHHRGPSTIGFDTLYTSGGKLPAAFLRGCGVPEPFIAYLPSLIGAQDLIQYYSCFISYSTKDDDFARRLYSRMRDEHLRVWFAPEDMKGGDKLYDQIEHAIQLHDRLLLVLSEDSIHSDWVMTEIRRARDVERKEQRRKLFPITLVSFDALRAWHSFYADTGEDLAEEVRGYYIPDFSTWKNDDAFEAAFARLLRDLRAAERPSG